MKQLKAEKITKTYGEKTLFRSIDLTITEGERIGLVGVNGTGKSTFLNIVSGAESPDSGSVTTGKLYTIGYLKQRPDLKEGDTVLQSVFSGQTKALQAMRTYESLLIEMGKHKNQESLSNEFLKAQTEMDANSAWDMFTEAKTILEKLRVSDLSAKINQLSGGQKKRVGLAQVLIETPDLLILDEPTNHLDYFSIKWLEDYLNRFKGAVLVVTHDRYFLDRVANYIVELDEGQIFCYTGNYEKFIEAKAIRMESEKAAAEKSENLYRKELKWMKRGPKARGTKQKARKERFQTLEETVLQTKKQADLKIDFQTSRLGKEVFTLEKVTKSFSKKAVLPSFSLIIQPFERIGITGDNGTGKSTLLNLLAGKLKADSGTIKVGQTVKIGYYTQQNNEMDEEKRLITYLNDINKEEAAQSDEIMGPSVMLERFLFPKWMHGKKINTLSGGEKRRLFLLKILMERPNVLLLDEPTNDLDVATLTVLEDYLTTFSGTVITVSHDRYFLDKVANKLLIFNHDGEINVFYGEYSEYLSSTTSQPNPEKKKTSIKEEMKPKPKGEKARLNFKERQEWATIEETITMLEANIKTLNQELENTGKDYLKATELSEQIAEKEYLLLERMERWEYLAQFDE